MGNEIKVLLYGLGDMGRRIAKAVLQKDGFEIVGAVDIFEGIVGKDLGEVLDLGKPVGVIVTDDVESLLLGIEANIAIITTTSYLKDVYPQIVKCVKAGIAIVSTCEELSYPYYKYPELSDEIHELAKRYGVTILGTGINPGFLMDALPIVLTGSCLQIESIKVTRMMDSSKRRISYQKKIGTGLSTEEFRKMIELKKITGHVGLVESIAMITDVLGWKLDEIKESPTEPLIAEKEIVTSYTNIKPSYVAGLKTVAHGIKNGKSVVILEFISSASIEEEYDAISIRGVPKINQRIIGGIHGDIGTVAMVINMIPKVLNANPGLVTMKDLPLPSGAIEDMKIYLKRKEIS